MAVRLDQEGKDIWGQELQRTELSPEQVLRERFLLASNESISGTHLWPRTRRMFYYGDYREDFGRFSVSDNQFEAEIRYSRKSKFTRGMADLAWVRLYGEVEGKKFIVPSVEVLHFGSVRPDFAGKLNFPCLPEHVARGRLNDKTLPAFLEQLGLFAQECHSSASVNYIRPTRGPGEVIVHAATPLICNALECMYQSFCGHKIRFVPNNPQIPALPRVGGAVVGLRAAEAAFQKIIRDYTLTASVRADTKEGLLLVTVGNLMDWQTLEEIILEGHVYGWPVVVAKAEPS